MCVDTRRLIELLGKFESLCVLCVCDVCFSISVDCFTFGLDPRWQAVVHLSKSGPSDFHAQCSHLFLSFPLGVGGIFYLLLVNRI